MNLPCDNNEICRVNQKMNLLCYEYKEEQFTIIHGKTYKKSYANHGKNAIGEKKKFKVEHKFAMAKSSLVDVVSLQKFSELPWPNIYVQKISWQRNTMNRMNIKQK